MNIFGIAQIINFVVLSLMALLIYKNDPKSKASQNFSLTLATLSLWCLFYFVWQLSDDYYMADFWLRILMFWVVFIPVFFIRFILHFFDIYEKRKALLYVIYAFSLFFGAGTLMGFISDGIQENIYLKFYPKSGPLFLPMITFFGITIMYSVYLLIKYYKGSTPLVRQQIKYIAIGIFFAYLINTTNYALWFGINIPPVGIFFLIVFFLFIAYSLLANHLLQIGLAFRKPTIKTFSFTILFIEVLLLTYSLLKLEPPLSIVLDIILTLLIAVSYSSIKHFTYKFSNKYFFTSFYNPNKLIASISEELISTLNLNAIYRIIDDSLTKNFHCKSIAILLYDEKNEKYLECYSKNISKTKTIAFSDKLNEFVKHYKKPVLVEEINRGKTDIIPKSIINVLSALEMDAISLMHLKHKVVGIIILGRKISGDVYSDVDLKVLKTVSEQAALSIENAQLYQEVMYFNTTLQQKVDIQTKELKEKTEHMRKLMEMRNEFLDIASHQLRTPVSLIKGVLSMIEEGSIPENKKEEFINGALEKSIKLDEIINDILIASEMETGNFTTYNEPTDLENILRKICDNKSRSAKIKKLKFSLQLPKTTLPSVMADEKYLEQALANLVNNAIRYTIKGTVLISAKMKDDSVIVSISDTGIGIPDENINKLFQKFARAKNAIDAYADGSGLGLFIAKKIIDNIPGAELKIENTKVGRGTTVTVLLPAALPVKVTA